MLISDKGDRIPLMTCGQEPQPTKLKSWKALKITEYPRLTMQDGEPCKLRLEER